MTPEKEGEESRNEEKRGKRKRKGKERNEKREGQSALENEIMTILQFYWFIAKNSSDAYSKHKCVS